MYKIIQRIVVPTGQNSWQMHLKRIAKPIGMSTLKNNLDSLNLGDVADRLHRNGGKELPIYTTSHPRKTKSSL
jgi:hypothetical protein